MRQTCPSSNFRKILELELLQRKVVFPHQASLAPLQGSYRGCTPLTLSYKRPHASDTILQRSHASDTIL